MSTFRRPWAVSRGVMGRDSVAAIEGPVESVPAASLLPHCGCGQPLGVHMTYNGLGRFGGSTGVFPSSGLAPFTLRSQNENARSDAVGGEIGRQNAGTVAQVAQHSHRKSLVQYLCRKRAFSEAGTEEGLPMSGMV